MILEAELLKIAQGLKLLPCGGSDYHAKGSSNEHLPGTGGPPLEIFNKLRAAATVSKK